MPVFKRGRGLGGWLPQAKRKKNDDGSSSRSDNPVVPPPSGELTIMSKIGYEWDKWHSLYKHLPEDILDLKEILRKEIGSFLNGAGGILCFGCRENGTIYGIDISRKEEDNLRQIIDNTLTRFHPFVHPNNYRVRFKEVSGVKGRSERKMVIEVKITANSRYIMYEDESHEVYVRDKDKYKGPLTPHEIKDLVTDLYYKRLAMNTNKSAASDKPSTAATSTSSSSSHPLEVCNKASKQDNNEIKYITISDDENDEACDTVTAKVDSKPLPSASDTISTKVDPKPLPSARGTVPTKVDSKLSSAPRDTVSTKLGSTVTKVDSKVPSSSTSTASNTTSTTSKANGGTFKRLVRKLNPFGSKSRSSKVPDSKAEVSSGKNLRTSAASKPGVSNKENIHVTQPMNQASIPTTTVSHLGPSYGVPLLPRPPVPSYPTSSSTYQPHVSSLPPYYTVPRPPHHVPSSSVYGVSATCTPVAQAPPISYPSGSHGYTSRDYGHSHYQTSSGTTGSQYPPPQSDNYTNAGQQQYYVYK